MIRQLAKCDSIARAATRRLCARPALRGAAMAERAKNASTEIYEAIADSGAVSGVAKTDCH